MPWLPRSMRRMTLLTLCLGLGLAHGRPLLAQDTAPEAHVEAKAVLAKGDVLPALEVQGLNGVDYTVDFPKDGPTTVLLVFLSSCQHCQAMLPGWSQAFDKKPPALKVVGIMLDSGSRGFFAFHKISFPVLRALRPRDLGQQLKANGVPMTIRVKPGGVVEDWAFGQLDEARLAQLFAASKG